MTLVSNAFFAPLLLGERIQRRDILCTAIIVTGCSVALAFATHDNPVYTAQDLFSFFGRVPFIVYIVISMTFCAILYGIAYKIERVRQVSPQGLAYMKLRKYHRFSYAALSGTMGAQSVLFAKISALLLTDTFAGRSILFVFPGTYFVLISLFVCIFFQIRWLNSGLKLFSALYIVPVFQSFWILVSVFAGWFFFDEYNSMSAEQSALFALGILMTVGGVYLLSSGRIATVGDDDEKGDLDGDHEDDEFDVAAVIAKSNHPFSQSNRPSWKAPLLSSSSSSSSAASAAASASTASPKGKGKGKRRHSYRPIKITGASSHSAAIIYSSEGRHRPTFVDKYGAVEEHRHTSSSSSSSSSPSSSSSSSSTFADDVQRWTNESQSRSSHDSKSSGGRRSRSNSKSRSSRSSNSHSARRRRTRSSNMRRPGMYGSGESFGLIESVSDLRQAYNNPYQDVGYFGMLGVVSYPKPARLRRTSISYYNGQDDNDDDRYQSSYQTDRKVASDVP